jgi:ankyrin repeat protein
MKPFFLKFALAIVCITFFCSCNNTKKKVHRKNDAELIVHINSQRYIKQKKEPYGSSAYSYSSAETEALFDAVRNNDLAQARRMIALGADVNELWASDFPHWGYTPLYYAINNGSLAMAKLLIDAGANVNEYASTGTGAMKGIDEEGDSRNHPLIVYAILLNDAAMVRLLLDNGAQVNQVSPSYKSKKGPVMQWTPLMVARKNSRDEIIKILKEYGAKD